MAARVAAEHLEIRASTRLLQAGDVSPDRARDLGSLLERHVRFEERELSPLVESSLGEEALRSLGAEVAAAES
jgi:hypothetical protein